MKNRESRKEDEEIEMEIEIELEEEGDEKLPFFNFGKKKEFQTNKKNKKHSLELFSVEERTKGNNQSENDHFAKLPKNLIIYIVSFLDSIKDRSNLSLTNRMAQSKKNFFIIFFFYFFEFFF